MGLLRESAARRDAADGREALTVFFGQLPQHGDDAPANRSVRGAGDSRFARGSASRDLSGDHHCQLGACGASVS